MAETAEAPPPLGPTVEPSSPVAAAPTETAPAAVPSLESLLAEFETEVNTAPTKTGAAPQAPPASSEGAKPAVPAAPGPVDQMLAGFEDWARANRLQGEVTGLAAELEKARTRVDQQDFEQVVSAGEKRLADAGLLTPKDYVREKLMLEAVQNARLRASFDNRGSDPRTFNRELRKAYDRIYEGAKSIPDKQATEDRAAVVHAMRGSTTKAPEEKAPDYGSMTSGEFAKELSKHGIF